MAKRALLVGCNYPGTKVELHGCANDVMRMHKTLTTRFGFDESDILVLLDTDSSGMQPTGANIRSCLGKLIRGVQPGDVLVFHYSGHGTQVPPEAGGTGSTETEEAIVPTDMNLLTDDDFRGLVNQIPDGATFTFISDSCHSGGLIDAEKVQIGDVSTGLGGAVGQLAGGNGGGNGGLMGLVSQGLQAFGNRGVQTRNLDFSGGGRRRDDDGEYTQGYGVRNPYQGEDYSEEGYGREGRRRYAGQGYEEEGQYGEDGEGYERRQGRRRGEYEEEGYERRRGAEEEYGGYGRRRGEDEEYEGYGGRGREEERYSGEGRRRRAEEEYGGNSYEQEEGGYGGRQQGYGGGGYEARQQGYGGGGYGEEGYGDGYQQSASRVKSKEIPIGMLTQILSQRTGHQVDVGNIRTTLFDMFGDQASPTVKMFANLVFQQLQGGGQGGWAGAVSSLATQFLQSKLDGQSPDQAASYLAPAENAGNYQPRPQPSARAVDVGVLLSGCQSNETSADANPSHNPADSYGAFSNAIQTVLSQTNAPISNQELILEVRKVLQSTGFKQHPCLYCNDQNADAPFICN